MMTNEAILKKIDWRDSNEARLTCYSPLFGASVEIHVLTTTESRIADGSFRIINDFIALSPAQLDLIKQFLWDDCRLCCDVTSYGFDVPDGQDEADINHREFNVHGPDDALKASNLKYLLIIEDDQESYPGNFGRLIFDNAWNSHLSTIVMKNGSIVGCGDSGLSLGQFV